jgi:hypothetical protein
VEEEGEVVVEEKEKLEQEHEKKSDEFHTILTQTRVSDPVGV